ncbi:MAG: GNAT family N-acetyltransferase [Phycisphaerae bacterium]|jgi:ribosomal protein S18 acetylase RimI-like enzyme
MAIVETLQADDLDEALAWLLAAPGTGELAGEGQVQYFREYLAQTPVTWAGQRVCVGTQVAALSLVLLLPGRTGIVMFPTPGELGIDPRAQRELAAQTVAELAPERLHYLQALLQPDAEGQRNLLVELGFQHLAPLVYRQRDATYPWVDPPRLTDAQWVTFSAETHDAFATTVLATYEDSLDCPELGGLRPIDDILAAHQACGVFDAGHWELLWRPDGPAGCLLLSRLPQTSALEVVYMGVVPACRGQGVGALLLRRALQQTREARVRRLTLVVDDRNEPAKRLYDAFGLRAVTRRDAWLYRFRGESREACA